MPDTTPTLAGFLTFCRTVVGIPIAAMPDADPGFATALAFAQEWIPDQIATYSPTLSTSAVYNWAASSIIQFQPDITGQVYFQGLRKSFGVTNFVPGVITTASNEATSDSVTAGKGLQNLQLIDLQRAKDPYGRQALAILQSLGTLWGLT